jgi:hypothetical protein
MVSSVILALLAVAGPAIAQESTLLYIPGFDPQALSADVIGVGSDGRTTYVLQAPAVQPTGTLFDNSDPFPATATLVEGSDYASVGAMFDDGDSTINFGAACTISASVALCTAGNGAQTITTTDDVIKFPVQLGTTAALVDPTPKPVSSTGGSGITPAASVGISSGNSLTPVKSTQSSGSSASTSIPSTSASSTSGACLSASLEYYALVLASLLVSVIYVA